MDTGDDPSMKRSITEVMGEYKLPLILGSISLLCIIVSIVLLVKSVQTSTPIVFHEENAATVSGWASELLSIDVAGAVNMPGVYELAAGSRVEDGITAAGGLSNDADTEQIALSLNRAATLKDGAKIYVPKKGKDKDSLATTSHNQIVQRNDVTSYNFSSLSRRPDGSSYNELISVNQASSSELDLLPGVGPVTAQKIIANRPYMSLDELVSKKAMGASLFGKLKDKLSL